MQSIVELFVELVVLLFKTINFPTVFLEADFANFVESQYFVSIFNKFGLLTIFLVPSVVVFLDVLIELQF